MTWKFYACIMVAALTVSAFAHAKLSAITRTRKAEEEKAKAEARKSAPPPIERPPKGPKNPWDLTDDDIERRIRGR